MRRALVAAVVLCASVIAPCVALADAAALIEKSGLSAAFEAIDRGFETAADASDDDMPDRARDAWRDAARELRVVERLNAETIAALQAALTPEQAAKVAAFYDTPLGQRIVAFETEALDDAVRPRLESEGERLREAMRSNPVRWAEHQAVIDNSGSIEFGVEITSRVFYAMILGMEASRGAGPSSVEDIEAVVANQVAAMRDGIVADAERSVAFVYRDFSLAELRDYNVFLSSPSGSAFYVAVLGALSRGLSEEVYAFARQLGRALEAKDI